jgi:hypothetical protein
MIKGINRASREQRTRAGSAGKSFLAWRDKSCVFISHQREDSEACKPIADYFIDPGVDVYFDQYDPALNALVATGDADRITRHIRDGVHFSTHMICVVSPNTIKSHWVPFEVGYGYDRVVLGVLTLKGMEDSELPEYMKTTSVLRGAQSLDHFLLELLKERKDYSAGRTLARSTLPGHPLARVLDWNK